MILFVSANTIHNLTQWEENPFICLSVLSAGRRLFRIFVLLEPKLIEWYPAIFLFSPKLSSCCQDTLSACICTFQPRDERPRCSEWVENLNTVVRIARRRGHRAECEQMSSARGLWIYIFWHLPQKHFCCREACGLLNGYIPVYTVFIC